MAATYRIRTIWDSILLSALTVMCVCPLSGSSLRGADEAESPLSLEIFLEEGTYLVGEPIWLDVTLSNTGRDTAVVDYAPICMECLTFQCLITADGDTLSYSGGPPGLWLVKARQILPGQALRESLNLLDYYGAPVSGTDDFERLIPQGTYSVRAFDGGIASNQLSVTVIEPSGLDYSIYEVMHDAYVLIGSSQWRGAATRLEALLPSLDDSPYRAKVYYMLALAALPPANEKYIAACRRIVEGTPNSHYAEYGVQGILRTMSFSEAKTFVEDLERRMPDSRAAEAARAAYMAGQIKS